MCNLLSRRKSSVVGRFSRNPVPFNFKKAEKKIRNDFPELSETECKELAEYEEMLYRYSCRAEKGIVGEVILQVGFIRDV